MNNPQDTQDGLDALRKRVAKAIEDAHHAEMMAFLRGEYAANTWRPEQYAKAALAALGLDDFDAAVLRASVAVHEQRTSSSLLDYGRAALEAALTPPEGDAST